MIALLCFFLRLLTSPFKSTSRLEAEIAALRHQLSVLQRTVTSEVLTGGGDIASAGDLIAAWQDRNRRAIERAAQLLTELRMASGVDPAMLSVALRELRSLA